MVGWQRALFGVFVSGLLAALASGLGGKHPEPGFREVSVRSLD
jgi:hypothetical protein